MVVLSKRPKFSAYTWQSSTPVPTDKNCHYDMLFVDESEKSFFSLPYNLSFWHKKTQIKQGSPDLGRGGKRENNDQGAAGRAALAARPAAPHEPSPPSPTTAFCG
jgi:hypothetical protein